MTHEPARVSLHERQPFLPLRGKEIPFVPNRMLSGVRTPDSPLLHAELADYIAGRMAWFEWRASVCRRVAARHRQQELPC
jgi:hypothetical protein